MTFVQPAEEHRPLSVLAEKIRSDFGALSLIVANLVPLVGVMSWGWTVFEVVFLFWLEGVFIGAINVLKMIYCSPDPNTLKLAASKMKGPSKDLGVEALDREHNAAKIFLAPFFVFHYGAFCAGHGLFVALLSNMDTRSESESIQISFGKLSVTSWTLLGLLVSHLISFYANYIARGEYRRTTVTVLMVAPYGRVAVMHFAILASGALVLRLGNPLFLLIALVVGKTILDLVLHFRSHEKLASQSGEKTNTLVS